MQTGFSAKGAGTVELIKIPTCAHCMENYKLTLHLSTRVYYQLLVVSTAENSGLDFVLFVVKLQRDAFAYCVSVCHAVVEVELQRQTGPMPQWTCGSAGSRLKTVSLAELHRQSRLVREGSSEKHV